MGNSPRATALGHGADEARVIHRLLGVGPEITNLVPLVEKVGLDQLLVGVPSVVAADGDPLP
jgi:hypothetical protein